jgi:hypothetical protein
VYVHACVCLCMCTHMHMYVYICINLSPILYMIPTNPSQYSSSTTVQVESIRGWTFRGLATPHTFCGLNFLFFMLWKYSSEPRVTSGNFIDIVFFLEISTVNDHFTTSHHFNFIKVWHHLHLYKPSIIHMLW